MTNERPKEVGPVFWFALVAALATVVLRVAGLGVVAFVALVLALFWTGMGLLRLRAIHKWAQQRHSS